MNSRTRTGDDLEQGYEPEPQQGHPSFMGSTGITAALAELKKQQRMMLRRKLREDMVIVQQLYSKLEERELQLREAQSVQILHSRSDAQLSGNDVTVTPQAMATSFRKYTTPRSLPSKVPRKLFGDVNSGTPTGTNISSRRTPKPNKLYNKADFILGDDKIPSRMQSRPKNGRKTQHVQGKAGIPTHIQLHCRRLLGKLMSHQYGWIFNKPVDPQSLGLYDYNMIIKSPMDLGTIRDKLDEDQYSAAQNYADDVRLTFDNAMTYNPPENYVHQMAIELRSIFEKGWVIIKEKLEKLEAKARHVGQVAHGANAMKPSKKNSKLNTQKTATDLTGADSLDCAVGHKPKMEEKAMISNAREEFQKIFEQLPHQMMDDIIEMMKQRNIEISKTDGGMEAAMDSDTAAEFCHHAKESLRTFQKNNEEASKKTLPETTPADNQEGIIPYVKHASDNEGVPKSNESSSSSEGSSTGDSDSTSDSSTGSSARRCSDG